MRWEYSSSSISVDFDRGYRRNERRFLKERVRYRVKHPEPIELYSGWDLQKFLRFSTVSYLTIFDVTVLIILKFLSDIITVFFVVVNK